MYKNNIRKIQSIFYIRINIISNYKNLMNNNEFLAEQQQIDWLRNNLK